MRFVVLTLAALATGTTLQAGDTWPQFRGPDANGYSDAKKLPLVWSADKGVVWKTPIHDRGWSSPVVWKDQIWLTAATADGKKLYALCVNRDSGKVVHDIHVFDVEKPEKIAAMNSYASPTGAFWTVLLAACLLLTGASARGQAQDPPEVAKVIVLFVEKLRTSSSSRL